MPPPHSSRRTLASLHAECTSLRRSSVDADEGKDVWGGQALREQLNANDEGKEAYELEADRLNAMEVERRARDAEKCAHESSRREADRASAPTGRGGAPKRGRPEDSVDLTSDGDEAPAALSPPPRNEEPPVRPRTTSRAPATQPPPPAPALGRGGSGRRGAGSWNDIQLGAPRRFVCSILGCERPFGSNNALLQHQREQDHWPKSAASLPTPAPADTSRAAARDRSASVPSSTPKTARTRDAVDLDEEPEEPVVTIPMQKVEMGTFDCGACEVAFSEKTISFYTDEATRFQPREYPEMIELEMTALTNIEIDKQRGLMCVTGFFGYDVPEHYSSFAVADGPKSRVLFHFVSSEGDGVWKGSDRDQRVKSLMQLSPDIKNKTNFNPDKKDFAAELKRFKRRQTGEEHVPKPPKAAAGRGSRGSLLQASATTGSGGSGSTSAGRFPGEGRRTDGKGVSGTPPIAQFLSGATPRPQIERNNHRPQRSGAGRHSGGSFDRDFGGFKKRSINKKVLIYPHPHPHPHLQPSLPPYTNPTLPRCSSTPRRAPRTP